MGKDSIYKDGDTRYVYVKNDEGGREKRIITTGESDENYTQVTEGLKEGSWFTIILQIRFRQSIANIR